MDEPLGVRRVADESPWWEDLELGGAEAVIGWLAENAIALLMVIAVVAIIVFLIRWVRQRRDQIQKLWVFILFFLTKRQMMIPLVIRLSEKDQLLDPELRHKLMEIRQKSRDVSFKKNPNQRLEIEEQVSKILFFYFSSLEKKDQIKPGTKFAKLVKDLEFIDAKLVQFQKNYNNEAQRWNKWVTMPVLSLLSRMIGVAPFRTFK
jgi:hypothetical protein